MFTVSPVVYGKVAEMICGRIGRSDYLSENLEFELEGVSCRMLFSAVVYRRHTYLPDAEYDELSDLVPVWWEFHTTIDGVELLNDFSFNELRQYFK